MKKSEAEKKWCPWASSRAVKYISRDEKNSCAAFVGEEETPSTLCITSKCMAWKERTINDAERQSRELSGKTFEPEGHCGLVNK